MKDTVCKPIPLSENIEELDTDFVNSALFIFTRANHVVLTVQGQRMWNVAFVTILPTHTKLHYSIH